MNECFLDIKNEKVHENLLHGVERFNTKQLKRTDTAEKIVLPSQKGR